MYVYLFVYSATSLNSNFGTLMYFSLIKSHNEARFGENVAELLLIPCICINHTEIESRYHLCLISCTMFLGKEPNRFRTDFPNPVGHSFKFGRTPLFSK